MMNSIWNIVLLKFIIVLINQIGCIPLDGSLLNKRSWLLKPTSQRTIRSDPTLDWAPMSLTIPTFSATNEDVLLDAFSTSSKEKKPEKPDVKSLNVVSNIAYRYANTLISSRVANPADVAQEVFFSVVIPETAFISGFIMEIDGNSYKAYVKEKEEAQRVYDNAVRQGQTAGHVKQSARDSNRFSVSVNIEPKKKVTFNLTYEELLKRELGVYRHVINLNPGQIVEDLTVDVYIHEERNITKLRAPEIQSGNEIDPDLENKDNDLADVELISPTTGKVTFRPTVQDQKRLVKKKSASDKRNKEEESDGFSGQFVVEYDVVRDPSGGQVLINDGYFVHFFAPTELPPLRKHVLFVLDVSGSMQGRKIEQLKHAMDAILSELHPDDYFNIIEFSYSVTVRNLDTAADSAVYQPWRHSFFYNDEAPPVASPESTHPFPATPDYVKKAKEIVQKMTAGGGTNINDALKTAIEIAKRGVFNDTKSNSSSSSPMKRDARSAPEPMIIFLTDGEPTVGVTRVHKILSNVDEFNGPPKASIFSLAFGEGADFNFLKKLSLAHNGFARQIYEAADASWQLRNFYNQISSPLLSNVSFVYPPDQVEEDTITKKVFNNLFGGSELVVSGRIKRSVQNVDCRVRATSQLGLKDYQVDEIDFIPNLPLDTNKVHKNTPLEKLWAYMTIRQLLDEQEIIKSTTPEHSDYPDHYISDSEPKKPKPTEPTIMPKDKALTLALKDLKDAVSSFVWKIVDCLTAKLKVIRLIMQPEGNDFIYVDTKPKTKPKTVTETIRELALKYSFVCPLTSLVVVKPNGSNDVNTESAKPGAEDHYGGYPLALSRPAVSKLAFQPYSNRIIGGVSDRLATTFSSNFNFMPPGAAGGYRSFPTTPRYGPSGLHGFDQYTFQAPSLPGAVRYPAPRPSNQQPLLEKLDVIEDETEATTTAPTNLTLDSITWLNSTRKGDELQLENKEKEINCRLGLTEPDVSYQECKIANTTNGVCRHLRHCVQQSITDDLPLYISDYLCIVPGNFAGICCSEKRDNASESTSEETTTVEITTAREEANKEIEKYEIVKPEERIDENDPEVKALRDLNPPKTEKEAVTWTDLVTTEKSETEATTEEKLETTETTDSSLDLTTEQTTVSQ